MSYFDDVQDNVQRNKIVKKFKYFDLFYYNIKRMITSDAFKKNGQAGVVHSGFEFNFKRKVRKGNITIYINSGYICTTISMQNEMYYTAVQCQQIVESDRKRAKSSSNDYSTRRSKTSSTKSGDDSSFNNPSNPSNPLM